MMRGYRGKLQTDRQTDNGHLIKPSVYGGPLMMLLLNEHRLLYIKMQY